MIGGRMIGPTGRPALAWLALGSILGCLLIIATPFLDRPGLYLDALLPDYLAVKMLHPAIPNTIWVLPGNLIFGRWPILAGSLYQGSLQAYLALPFTWLLGPTVVTARLLSICEAIAVCLATFALVRRISGSLLLAWLASLLLAMDPAFVFAFRTQAYSPTFPIFFTLCGCLLLADREPAARRDFAAGILFGLAAWGYFVHLFVLPGALLFLLTRRPDRSRSRLSSVAAFGGGLAIGGLPYVIGYALVIGAIGNISDALAWFHAIVADLHVDTGQTLAGRAGATLSFAAVALTGEWIWRVVWGLWHTDYGQIAKVCLLLAAPAAGFAFSRRDSAIRPAARLLLYMIVSYVTAAMVFGGRMGGHHFVLLLPLLYALFGLSLGMILERGMARRSILSLAGVGLVFFWANLFGSLSVLQQLRTVDGNNFYSHVVSEYPLRALASGRPTPHIFMDWGGLMQFTYLTDGRIAAYGREELTDFGRVSLAEKICGLGTSKLVFLGPEASRRGRAETERLRLATSDTEVLRARTGSFEYALFTVATPPAVCDELGRASGKTIPSP